MKCKAVLAVLGTRFLEAMKNTCVWIDRQEFLLLLAKDLPTHALCQHAMFLAPRMLLSLKAKKRGDNRGMKELRKFQAENSHQLPTSSILSTFL
jgi:hypothetical protein